MRALHPLSIPSSQQSPPNGDATSPISARLPWALNTSLGGLQFTPGRPPLQNGMEHSPHAGYRQHHHPGPISMPPFPSLENGNFSPLQTRGLPPMTPSMPGFVFNAYPDTPPIHPHFLLSPGDGPFSPGIPVTSPPAFGYNPFLNATPGGPVHFYPQQGGSAQLGTPTTQAFPNGHAPGYSGQPGPPQISQTLMDGSGYFPTVPAEPSSPSPRVTSRSSAVASPLNAKDRLAPNRPDKDLAHLTAGLSLGGHTGFPGRSAGDVLAGPEKVGMVQSRVSLDGVRPNLEMGWNGDRRASFGDIGSGR